MIRDNKVVYGGGAAELSCAVHINNQADNVGTIDQYALRAFADALECIPTALANNSGLPPIETVTALKTQISAEQKSWLGVDCLGNNTNDMKELGIYESLNSKVQ
jgi:T-complex protein 1 subunit epsilon